MAWYKAGTVGVTNGATAVVLSGGDALANIFAGDTFKGPDGRDYEIAQVTSASGFTLAQPYQGATASGQAYAIQPTADTGALRLLLDQVSNLVTNYQQGRDAWSTAPAGTLKGRKSAGAGAVENLSPADVLALLMAGGDAAALTGGETLPVLQGGGPVKVTSLRLLKEILSLPSENWGIGSTTAAGRLHVKNEGGPCVVLSESGTAGNGYFRSRTSLGDWASGTGIVTAADAWMVYDIKRGLERFRIDASGNVGIGTSTPSASAKLDVAGNIRTTGTVDVVGGASEAHIRFYQAARNWQLSARPDGFAIRDATAARDAALIDGSGNILIGRTTRYGNERLTVMCPDAAEGPPISAFGGPGGVVHEFFYSTGATASTAGTSYRVNRHSITGRSLNAGGTLNASGADYAEYMLKAVGCGVIEKGQVCGINADGLLTDRFAEAHTFVIKSTDPAYVGNDAWSQAVGPRPDQPALDLPAYSGPERPDDDDPDYETKLAEWTEAQSSHLAAVEAARAAHATAVQHYEADLAEFEGRLEAERVKWDRIAFSGQVPVNVQGAQPGQYIDAAPDPDGGIIGVPVDEPGPRTVGKVWRILEDGRAWVAVMIS